MCIQRGSFMRAFLVVLPLASFILACPAPRPVPPVGEGEIEANECDTGEFTIPRPDAAAEGIGAAIDMGCIGAPVALSQSAQVKVQGCVDIFGAGGRAKRGLKLAIFDDAQNPGTETPAHGEV